MGERKLDEEYQRDPDMIEEIDKNINAVYIVADGKMTTIDPMQFGEILLILKKGKVFDVVRSERIRITGQDVV